MYFPWEPTVSCSVCRPGPPLSPGDSYMFIPWEPTVFCSVCRLGPSVSPQAAITRGFARWQTSTAYGLSSRLWRCSVRSGCGAGLTSAARSGSIRRRRDKKASVRGCFTRLAPRGAVRWHILGCAEPGRRGGGSCLIERAWCVALLYLGPTSTLWSPDPPPLVIHVYAFAAVRGVRSSHLES